MSTSNTSVLDLGIRAVGDGFRRRLGSGDDVEQKDDGKGGSNSEAHMTPF